MIPVTYQPHINLLAGNLGSNVNVALLLQGNYAGNASLYYIVFADLIEVVDGAMVTIERVATNQKLDVLKAQAVKHHLLFFIVVSVNKILQSRAVYHNFDIKVVLSHSGYVVVDVAKGCMDAADILVVYMVDHFLRSVVAGASYIS